MWGYVLVFDKWYYISVLISYEKLFIWCVLYGEGVLFVFVKDWEKNSFENKILRNGKRYVFFKMLYSLVGKKKNYFIKKLGLFN